MIVVFDAYGTLWDFGAIEKACAQVVDPDYARALLDLWRQKQLEYAFLRTVMDRYTALEEIAASALNRGHATQPSMVDARSFCRCKAHLAGPGWSYASYLV